MRLACRITIASAAVARRRPHLRSAPSLPAPIDVDRKAGDGPRDTREEPSTARRGELAIARGRDPAACDWPTDRAIRAHSARHACSKRDARRVHARPARRERAATPNGRQRRRTARVSMLRPARVARLRCSWANGRARRQECAKSLPRREAHRRVVPRSRARSPSSHRHRSDAARGSARKVSIPPYRLPLYTWSTRTGSDARGPSIVDGTSGAASHPEASSDDDSEPPSARALAFTGAGRPSAVRVELEAPLAPSRRR